MAVETIFYSWQSDLPNPLNRRFIEEGLERAARSIRDDESIAVEPVIDRDTANVPGAPEIVSTILGKIREASVFVADVSIINRDFIKAGARPTPNPNVAIELGYALHALGPDRVVMVMNTAFGGPEELPFDLRMRRVIQYQLATTTEDRSEARKTLERDLSGALRTILQHPRVTAPVDTPLSQAIAAAQQSFPNEGVLVKQFMADLTKRLSALQPDLGPRGDNDDALVAAIASTLPLVAEFTECASRVAEMGSEVSTRALYRGLSSLVDRYHLPVGFSGSFNETDFDFYRFLGHELLTTLTAVLMREERWQILVGLLDDGIIVRNARRDGAESFSYLSQHMPLLRYRKERLNQNWISPQGAILHERHSQEPLSGLLSFQDFLGADLFLYLRSIAEQQDPRGHDIWIPWTAVYSSGQTPTFLAEATRRKPAERLAESLRVQDVEALRALVSKGRQRLNEMFSGYGYLNSVLGMFDPNSIGSR